MNSNEIRERIFPSLAIVTIDGYQPDNSEMVDPPGSANYFCEQCYGMAPFPRDPDHAGILEISCDDSWTFRVLIKTDEVPELKRSAGKSGYKVVESSEVRDAMTFGDNGSTVTITKHPNGWIVMD
jgi:hypothetical protein